MQGVEMGIVCVVRGKNLEYMRIKGAKNGYVDIEQGPIGTKGNAVIVKVLRKRVCLWQECW